jgi:chain length determinant protein EpsF
MTLTQLLSVTRARWKVIAAVVAAGTLVAGAVTLLSSKRYEATATVVVDSKGDPLSMFAAGGAAGANTLMATQYDIIRSDIVARKVLEKSGLLQTPTLRQAWEKRANSQGSYVGWASTFIKQNLIIKPSRESNVIEITYEGEDPRFAAALANAFASAYIDTSLELRVAPARQYARFFDDSLAKSKAKVDEARAKLSGYLRDNDLISSDERLDTEINKLNELSQQLVLLGSATADTANRAAQSSDRLQDVMNHPNVTSIKSSIVAEEARLGNLMSTLGDNHPQVIQARAGIAELKQKLSQEIRKIGETVVVSNNVSRGREADVRAAYDQQRKRVLKLKEARDAAAVLAKDVENAELSYQNIAARLNQTGLEGQTSQTNVQLLSAAEVPSLASKPNPTLNMSVGAVLSLILGFMAAFFIEMRNRRLRTEEDIEEMFGEAPLTTLSSISSAESSRFFSRLAIGSGDKKQIALLTRQ